MRVLVVEDYGPIRGSVTQGLRENGFAVDSSDNGRDGLCRVETNDYDVIVLDLMLPGIDGLEVCRRIRAASRVPILMLTAKGDETDRIVGLEMGADDYLPKPFNPRELLARIRAVLRRAGSDEPSEASPVLRAGPLVVDAGSRTVTVGGRPVDLTTAEFDILHALAASAGRVLSRDQLLQQVHGEGWAAYDRSVDVHVSRIRQKIEDDPRRPALLKTVRGVGYQLARTETA